MIHKVISIGVGLKVLLSKCIYIFNCYRLFFVFRLMCTVLVFSSARFASGNYQILTGVPSKSPW